jgi:actin-like ATPase involved in cell morphogenesis
MNRICLDLGSEALRASGTTRGLTELRPVQRPISRGVLIDAETLDRSLAELVGYRRGQPLVLSTPAGPPADEVAQTLETTARLLRARTVRAVPAPVAALRGAGFPGPALVVDLGAELTEVSWVEASGFQIGTSLPWGIDDLRLALWQHLQTRHRVAFAPADLSDHWAGGTVAARCRTSHATRIIRVTAEDVDTVIHDGREQIKGAVQRLERASQRSDAAHLLVGGGALLPDLRRRLLPAGVRWRIARQPAHAVVMGLRAA